MKQSHAAASATAAPTLVEAPTHRQLRDLHDQIDRKIITKQIVQGLLRGSLVLQKMKREEWIAREMDAMKRSKDLELFASPTDSDRIAASWQKGVGVHDRYLPTGLQIRSLLQACGAAGIKLYKGDNVPSGGEALQTEEGILTVEFGKIMVPTNRDGHPFCLNFDQHVEWAKQEGGDGMTSVEETLYALLRAWLELDRMPFMGGWIRCRNTCGSVHSLEVSWDVGLGLEVSAGSRTSAHWRWGAFPRQFRSVG